MVHNPGLIFCKKRLQKLMSVVDVTSNVSSIQVAGQLCGRFFGAQNPHTSL